MSEKIAVVGLGYVGLPLALLAEEKGFQVIGLEKSQKKLSLLKDGVSVIDDEKAAQQLSKSKINFTDDYSKIKDRDIVIVCVPTPVDEHKNPDLSLVKSAALDSAKNMKKGSLLIIESTINPGVCDEVIIPMIESETDHKIGKTLHIAHCPERINPGDKKWHVGNINRVLGADSEAGLEIAYKFYDKLVDGQIKKMATIKEAEAVKVVENSFRDINIAFVNELAMSFNELGINVYNVIDGAATKPFAFMPHYPGIGVGGHCIPVDPYYLIEYAKNNGFDHKFLKLARSINETMPIYSVNLLEKTLIEKTGKTLDGSKVAVLGVSYKPNVGDDRESPSFTVIKALKDRNAQVIVYDPYIPTKSTVKSLGEALKNADAVILATAHKEFTDITLDDIRDVQVVLDGRGALQHLSKQLQKTDATYIGLGS